MAFTYVHRGLLDGSLEFAGGAQILKRVRTAGEPWTCGFDPAELGTYLAPRGWTLVDDLSADEYIAGGTSALRRASCRATRSIARFSLFERDLLMKIRVSRWLVICYRGNASITVRRILDGA
jgi:O-methyltransferase involved in polyketide biosynthesis